MFNNLWGVACVHFLYFDIIIFFFSLSSPVSHFSAEERSDLELRGVYVGLGILSKFIYVDFFEISDRVIEVKQIWILLQKIDIKQTDHVGSLVKSEILPHGTISKYECLALERKIQFSKSSSSVFLEHLTSLFLELISGHPKENLH